MKKSTVACVLIQTYTRGTMVSEGRGMLRCVVKWTCNHCERDFHIDPDTVEIDAVLALTDSKCPECGHAGAAVTLTLPDDSAAPQVFPQQQSGDPFDNQAPW
jgi:hypothetical protein